MTAETFQIPRPLPTPSPFSRPFWEAAHRHQLLIQRCTGCQMPIFYPRYNCPHCGSRGLEWVKASGRGTVYTYTVARRPTHPAFADRVPYVIAIVELEEGPRLTTNIVGCDPGSVRIGMPVEVTFEDVDEEISLVMFRPASQARRLAGRRPMGGGDPARRQAGGRSPPRTTDGTINLRPSHGGDRGVAA